MIHIGNYGTVITDAINDIADKEIFKVGDNVDLYEIAKHLQDITTKKENCEQLSNAFGISPTVYVQALFGSDKELKIDQEFWKNFIIVLERFTDN